MNEMKKNYIAPEMEVLAVEVQPVCLSEYNEEANDTPALSKHFDSIFDDEQDPTIGE